MSFLRRSSPKEDGGRFVVVGLGNPGPRYAETRHNLGAKVVHLLAERAGTAFKTHKSGCLVAEGRLAGAPVVLARPMSYMNESGRPVGQLVRFYKTPPERVLVVHDELDLPFADVRVKFDGGVAGHNGLRSVASHLHTKAFPRIRIGISRPSGERDAADHVLSEFSSAERRELPAILDRAADAAERVLADGVDRAMNAVNTRG